MSKERITCKRYCIEWNDIDKDCELFGENHPCPRKCPFWLQGQEIRVSKEENEVQDE